MDGRKQWSGGAVSQCSGRRFEITLDDLRGHGERRRLSIDRWGRELDSRLERPDSHAHPLLRDRPQDVLDDLRRASAEVLEHERAHEVAPLRVPPVEGGDDGPPGELAIEGRGGRVQEEVERRRDGRGPESRGRLRLEAREHGRRSLGARIEVVGPVCETGDFFARDRELPSVDEGDLLAILDTGAYGMALASNYNTRARPAEVLVEGKSVKLVRRRETIADLLRPERDVR